MTEGEDRELKELSGEECYRLLATQQIGRLGVNAEHYPLIFPVSYALDHGVIVVRTHPGTKLTAADHTNVTFEVDEIDQRTRSGWSVLVPGLAEEVTTAHRAELVERTRASGAHWLGWQADRRVRGTRWRGAVAARHRREPALRVLGAIAVSALLTARSIVKIRAAANRTS